MSDISYPAFVAALDGLDVELLAARAGVGVDEIHAITAGGVPVSLSVQMRLAAVLDEANPFELFRLGDDDLQRASTLDVEAQGHPRYAADPAALRVTR